SPTLTLFPYTTLFRSSDRSPLRVVGAQFGVDRGRAAVDTPHPRARRRSAVVDHHNRVAGPVGRVVALGIDDSRAALGGDGGHLRSEEHTSELQSLAYL